MRPTGAEADGALDKARKHKKRQLEDTLNLVMKKRKVNIIYEYFLLHLCLVILVAILQEDLFTLPHKLMSVDRSYNPKVMHS